METIKILEMILPVVLVIAVGFFCGKREFFSKQEIASIKKFAVNVSLTAVVFVAFATGKYSIQTVIVAGLVLLVCFLTWYIGKLINRFFSNTTPYLPYILSGFEAGMLGYTLYSILYGSDVSAFATVDLGQVLFVFTFYKIQISRSFASEKRINIKREILTSPIILGIIAGLIIGVSGLHQSMIDANIVSVFDTTFGFIAAPTSALILFSIGYDLSSGKIYWGRAFKYAFLRLFLLLGILFVILGLSNLIFDMDQSLKRAFIIMFLMPSPFVLPIFANDEVEQSTIASVLSISTLISLLAFVVLAITGV